MATELATTKAIDAGIGDEPEPEQLSLIDQQPETAAGQRKLGEVTRRGPGRPPGARNRRTEATARWFLGRHKHPIDALLEVVDTHPADLAGLLKCTLAEAQTERRLCAIGALPYVASRMPISVDLTNHQVVHLQIFEGPTHTTNPGGDGLGITLAGSLVEIIENQPDSETPADGVGSDGVGSKPQDADDAGE